MNHIEVAKLIIKNSGCATIGCHICPAQTEKNKKGLNYCNELWGGEDKSLEAPFLIEWFKNWLKENDKETRCMKKYASVKIKNTEYDKTVTIDITGCSGIIEIFKKIDSILIDNCIFNAGDKLEYINFYEVEDVQ